MLAAKTFFDMPTKQLTPCMEEDFFSSLMMKNKTYKTTFHDRFSDINPCIAKHLLNHGLTTPSILDVGASSGISTVELYDDLLQDGIEAGILATDLLIDAFLVKVFPGCYALVDPSGYPLRFDLPLVTMKPWVTRDDYYNGIFILRKSVNILFTYRANQILRRPCDAKVRAVKLVTPRALCSVDISFCSDDIRKYNSEYESRFDFVRSANILNKGYFSTEILGEMISNVGRYLRNPHGILLVARTHEDRCNHGTLFRRTNNQKLEVIQRFGSGSEIEDLVLRTKIAS